MDAYKIMYRRFAESIPTAWLYTLYHKDLDRYWRDSGSFDKQEFETEEKCKGISEL